jgi:biotin carboxyl carrier protein
VAREVVEIPMSGKILSINVKVGDTVKEDDELGILESMKMENPIIAPVSGKIVEVGVSAGTMVEGGKTAFVIEY